MTSIFDKNIFFVSKVSKHSTKNGNTVYSFFLDNSTWVNNINPTWRRKIGRKWSVSEPLLYKFWEEHHNSLMLVKGKYISCYLFKDNYGAKLSNILSLDLISDFKEEIDLSDGESFKTKLPIYDFLLLKNRDINSDKSISLKSNYNSIRVIRWRMGAWCYNKGNKDVLPYLDTWVADILTVKNIDKIFEKFYKDIPLKGRYARTVEIHYSYNKEDGIYINEHRIKVSMKMTTSGDYDKWFTTPILRYGDALSDEQKEYLESIDFKSSELE